MKSNLHIGVLLPAALVAVLGSSTILSNTASAQTTYYWGSGQLEDSVTVDLSVLETLGNEPTVPGLLSPRKAPVSPVYGTTSSSSYTAAAPSVSGKPRSGLTSNILTATPTPKPVSAPKPTSTVVAPTKQQKPVAVAITPKPAPAPIPAPTAAPQPSNIEATSQVAKAPAPTPVPVPAPKSTKAPVAAPEVSQQEKTE
ncbi:MAG: hypothetical protein R3261_01145, partial [Alphaproteobacteria bacterium]|nr:hypothetical protein [Alphaproteobacteria bacterium]